MGHAGLHGKVLCDVAHNGESIPSRPPMPGKHTCKGRVAVLRVWAVLWFKLGLVLEVIKRSGAFPTSGAVVACMMGKYAGLYGVMF